MTLSESEKDAINRIIQIFDNKLTFEKALELFEKLGKKKWPFARACILFQSAIRCGKCQNNPEFKQDIEVALLCSSIEAVTESHSSITFKDWLIQKKLKEISMKDDEKQLARCLNQAYQEYIDSEPEREGAFHNFREFLFENCPNSIQKAPISVYDTEKKDFIPAHFKESLGYVYSKYRSFFLHRGIGRATNHVPKGFEGGTMIWDHLIDSYRKKGYKIDKTSFVNWFENIVKESLWNFLTK